MQTIRPSAEVLYPAEPIVTVERADFDVWQALAAENPRQRIRLCAHPDTSAAVHEMLIVHAQSAYVRAHRHLDRSESYHVIQGRGDLVLLADDGTPERVVQLGAYDSGATFFIRIPAGQFHTLLVRTPWFLFHETTAGPFDPTRTEYASWAPTDDQPAARDAYLHQLQAAVAQLQAGPI